MHNTKGIKEKGIKEYIHSLMASERLGDQVVHHMVIPDHPPILSKPGKPWSGKNKNDYEISRNSGSLPAPGRCR